MSVYLDTSVIVSLFVKDDNAARARTWAASSPMIVLSRWTLTEFTSALTFQVRKSRLTVPERIAVEATFDGWTRRGRLLEVEAEHFDQARELLRRNGRLRSPDALHLAIARAHELPMATLDEDLLEAARAEGLSVVDL